MRRIKGNRATVKGRGFGQKTNLTVAIVMKIFAKDKKGQGVSSPLGSIIDNFLIVVSFSEVKANNGLNVKIYSSNNFGKSQGHVLLETTPSKVAELQSGE